MFEFISHNAVEFAVLLGLILLIAILSKVTGEPAISFKNIDTTSAGDDEGPWAGGPTGVAIGAEEVGNV